MDKSSFFSLITVLLFNIPSVLCAEEVALRPFNRLLLVGNKNTEVVLHSAEECKMVVNGVESTKVLVGVVDSTLTMATAGQEADVLIRVDIYAPSFRNINCSFLKSLSCHDTIESEELAVIANYSDINLLLHVDYINLSYEGSKAELIGICREANVCFHGSVDGKRAILEATNLETRDMHIDCGIYSLVNLYVINSLWLTGGVNATVNVLGSSVIMQNNLSDYHLVMTDRRNERM